MSRVGVFARTSGDNREVTIGGRSRNESISSWINFDWFRKETRAKKRGTGTITEKVEDGTDSITTSVRRDEDGKIWIDIKLPDITSIPADCIQINIKGDGVPTLTLHGMKGAGEE